MTNVYDSCRVTKAGNIALARGRMIYPAVFEPSKPKGAPADQEAKYQVTVLLPKSANLDLLVKAVDDLIAESVPAATRKTAKIKKPFIKTEDQPRFAEYAEEFPVMLRMSSKTKPGVVNAQAQPVTDDSEVYGGRWASVSVRPYFYDHPTGGKGVSLGLQNIQLLEHDDPLGGGRVKAEDEFEAVGVAPGGTASSMFE